MNAGPGLAVVIPTLDDGDALTHLLNDLSRQRDVEIEVWVSDGGSHDGTDGLVRELALALPYPIHLLTGSRGRAAQMNRGARAAKAPDLLFLHADTRMEDAMLLARSWEHMEAERSRRRTVRVAGHFALRFLRSFARPSRAYAFYEAKSRLNRPECVNGDQGIWVNSSWFAELGGFDESLPFLEDARFASRAASSGVWTLLPGQVWTSARRFEVEGLLQRQTLNALIRTFEALGDSVFFEAAEGLYRSHQRTGRVDLYPFFRQAHRAVFSGPARSAAVRWYKAGSYVRGQAWQLALWVDLLKEFRRGRRPEDEKRWLETAAPVFDRLTDHPAGRGVATVLTAGWFYLAYAWLGFRRLTRGRKEFIGYRPGGRG